jgi:dienelactone hydrolase
MAARVNYLLTLVVVVLVSASVAVGAESNTGLWKLDELKQAPEAQWGETRDGVQEVYYAGEPYRGKPTKVFAYFAKPDGGGKFPAMVLVHGGGGKAFRDWALHWAKRGYVALAMDLSGNGPSGRLPDGGPDQSDESKFRPFTDDDARDMWTYHAVANVIRGHSLLAAHENVDPDRIGITGISWGGYLTCIVAGVDDRLKVAVPVYGCGFLSENSVWKDRLAKMPAEQRERWDKWFDPRHYVGQTRCPILFLNGTNDFAYPLDSYQKTYSLPKSDVTISIVPRLAHGHIWTFPIVDLFVDSVLREGKKLPTVSEMAVDGDIVSCNVSSPTQVVRAELHYTTDVGPWQKRVWKQMPAELVNGKVTAKLPADRPLVWYLAVTNDRELMISTPHQELP